MSDVPLQEWPPRGRRRTSLAREVADDLVEQIAAGRWRPGDQLPPEPTLAEGLGVSRSSVREAISHLQAQGLVRVVHGRGTYVLEASPSLLVPDGIVDLIARSPERVQEVHEARLVLELGIVELAAARADERDVAELREVVAQSRRLLEQGLTGHETEAFELGLAFHVRLAQAARSPLLAGLYSVLVEPPAAHVAVPATDGAQPPRGGRFSRSDRGGDRAARSGCGNGAHARARLAHGSARRSTGAGRFGIDLSGRRRRRRNLHRRSAHAARRWACRDRQGPPRLPSQPTELCAGSSRSSGARASKRAMCSQSCTARRSRRTRCSRAKARASASW